MSKSVGVPTGGLLLCSRLLQRYCNVLDPKRAVL